MTTDQFWEIVEHVNSVSPGDMPLKCANLEVALRARPLHETVDFERHFRGFLRAAFSNDLWAAAVVICNGCGDDSFMDFRSTLISMGKAAYTNALADPETLADTNIDPEWARFGGYQDVAGRIWREQMGEAKDFPPDPNETIGTQAYPREPSGRPFVEWELSKRLPRLAAKFGFADSDWFVYRDAKERQEKKQRAAEEFAERFLRGDLIPPNGLIAPYRLLRERLKENGGGDAAVDLDEGVFWAAVALLEKLPAEKLRDVQGLRPDRLKLDVSATKAGTFEEWFENQR